MIKFSFISQYSTGNSFTANLVNLHIVYCCAHTVFIHIHRPREMSRVTWWTMRRLTMMQE